MIGGISRRQVLFRSIFVFVILLIFFGVSYALLEVRVGEVQHMGTEIEVLSLEFVDGKEAIVLDHTHFLSEEEGMAQEAFHFQVINRVNEDLHYVLKLDDMDSIGELSLEGVKYGLSRPGFEGIFHVKELKDGVIDLGVVAGREVVDYELRFWIEKGEAHLDDWQGRNLRFLVKVARYQENVDVLKIRYENSQYTTCRNVDCALRELYQKVVVGEGK